MAITVNNLQTSATDTLAYTPSSVTDSCLVILVSSEDVAGDEPITAINFGATTITLQVIGTGMEATNSNDIAIGYLANPGTSSQTITVTGGQHDRMGIVALTLDNVDQSSTVDTSDGSSLTVKANVVPTSSTTSNNDSFVISGSSFEDDTQTLSVVGATEIVEFAPPSSKVAVGNSLQSIAGLYTHTWSSSGSVGRFSAASVAFNLSSGSGVTVTVNPIDQAQTIDQVTLTQHSVLTIGGLSQAQTVDQVTLQQGGVLSLNNLDQIQTIDQVNLTQAHIVTIANVDQVQALEQIVLSAVGAGTVAINDLSQAQVLDQLTLAQLNVVSVDNLSQAQLLDSINFNGVVVGFLQGALTIVSAYNGQIKLTNPLTGEIRIL